MPLYRLICPECGSSNEEFCHVAEDKGSRTHLCACGGSMTHTLSVGGGLTFFEEGRGRWIANMGHEPVYITSHEQHKTEMRKRGLEWATRGRGEAGSWV